MNPDTIVPLLVQAGAVGLCFYLIYVNKKMSNGQLSKMIDVVQNNSTVIGKFSEKLDELIRR
jgi:hypothetical protein